MTAIPFDSADVARRIMAGDVVRLGPNITLHKRGNQLVQQCRRCVLEVPLTFTPAGIIDQTEDLAKFIFKHQHTEPAS